MWNFEARNQSTFALLLTPFQSCKIPRCMWTAVALANKNIEWERRTFDFNYVILENFKNDAII